MHKFCACSYIDLLDIATLGSILDFQLSWESGKLHLARWSHRVVLFLVRTDWTRPTQRVSFNSNISQLYLIRCSSNINGRVVRPFLKDHFSLKDICSCNICPGDDCHSLKGFDISAVNDEILTKLWGFRMESIFQWKSLWNILNW